MFKPVEQKINRIAPNGKYVRTENHFPIANRDKAGVWELFTLVHLNNNDECAILSYDKFFLCSDLYNNNHITANRDEVGAWEIVKIIKLENNEVAFKAANGKYWSLDEKTNLIFATGETIGKNEKFKIVQN